MSATTIHKLYWDFEKEELWLNDLAARGLALTDYCWGTYRFEQSAPGQWQYRIELLPQNARKPASREYLDFMADAGVQTVATYMSWVYFRKATADGPFELFSDLESRIAHYTRVLTFFSSLMAALVPLAAVSVINLTSGRSTLEFIFIPVAIQVGAVALLATQAYRTWRRLESLRARKRLFE